MKWTVDVHNIIFMQVIPRMTKVIPPDWTLKILWWDVILHLFKDWGECLHMHSYKCSSSSLEIWHSFHASHSRNPGVIALDWTIKILWHNLLLHVFNNWDPILHIGYAFMIKTIGVRWAWHNYHVSNSNNLQNYCPWFRLYLKYMQNWAGVFITFSDRCSFISKTV